MWPTISQQRSGEDKQGLSVRRRNQWGARRSYTDERTVNTATRLFFHITITNPSSYRTNDAHARAVEAIGIARFSNTGISYNMGVMPDASIYEFQPLGRRGAHTVNDKRHSTCRQSGCPNRGSSLSAPSWNLNYNARAVVICQNVNDPVSLAQIRSVAKCGAAWKRAGFVSNSARWHGHRCVSAKSCPGDKAWQYMSQLQSMTDAYTSNGLGSSDPEEDDMPDLKEIDELFEKKLKELKSDLKRDLRSDIVFDRYYDYVNPKGKETTQRHQVARTHQRSHQIWFKILDFSWWRDFVGNAIWSRQAGGDGDMHATKLGRADRNAAKAVVLAEANNKLLAKLVDRDPSSPLTSEDVEHLFREAIAEAMVEVQLDVSVNGKPDESSEPASSGEEASPAEGDR